MKFPDRGRGPGCGGGGRRRPERGGRPATLPAGRAVALRSPAGFRSRASAVPATWPGIVCNPGKFLRWRLRNRRRAPAAPRPVRRSRSSGPLRAAPGGPPEGRGSGAWGTGRRAGPRAPRAGGPGSVESDRRSSWERRFPWASASWERSCPARKWGGRAVAVRCRRDTSVPRTHRSQDERRASTSGRESAGVRWPCIGAGGSPRGAETRRPGAGLPTSGPRANIVRA